MDDEYIPPDSDSDSGKKNQLTNFENTLTIHSYLHNKLITLWQVLHLPKFYQKQWGYNIKSNKGVTKRTSKITV